MPLPAHGEGLLVDHAQGLTEGEHVADRRGAGELLVDLLALESGLPVEVPVAQVGVAAALDRTLVGPNDAETRRGHETLLRRGNGDVDTPGIHVEFVARHRRNAVDDEEGR